MKKILTLFVFLLSLIMVFSCTEPQEQEPKSYFVTLIHNANETVIEYEPGSIFEGMDIEEEGYLFYGWYDGEEDAIGSVINSDKTFVGKYIKRGTKFNINYVVNGGELRSYSPMTYEVGKTTKLYRPYPVGDMRFLGWYINDQLVEEIGPSYCGDLDVVAKWEDNNVYLTVEYNFNGGKVEGDLVTTFMKGYVDEPLPIPSKDGYMFKGWFTEDSFENRIYKLNNKVETNLNLYAKFVEYTAENIGVSFLGDSITTFVEHIPSEYPTYYPTPGCDVDTVEETWWHQVLTQTNYNLVANNSSSGSKVTSGYDSGQGDDRLYKLSKDGVSPDVLFIYMGTNDLSHSVSGVDFEKAYRNMIKKIRELCDDVIIYVLNIPSFKYEGFIEERKQYNQIIAKIADDEDLILVDIASVLNEDNKTQYLFAGAHPNAAGMRLISQTVLEKIEEYNKK